MQDYLKTYRAVLTVHGPLHIGAGHSIGKKEYIFDSRAQKVYIPDLPKMYYWLWRNGYQDKFEEYLLKKNGDLYGWLCKNKIAPQTWRQWIAYTLDAADAVSYTRTKIEIQTCMKDKYGQIYVPGSSLKGALRTAILGAVLCKNREKLADDVRKMAQSIMQAEKQQIQRNAFLRSENEKLAERVFHTLVRNDKKKSDKVNDFMAGLRVSDSKPLSTDCLILCRKQDERKDGEKKELNLARECIRPGTQLEFDVTVDTTLCKWEKAQILWALRFFGQCYTECFGGKFASGDKLAPNMFYLGGGSGFASKTVVYPLLGSAGLKTVSKIIDTTLPVKIRHQHKHFKDVQEGVSPHTIKKTTYNGRKYSFGLCSLDMEEI